MTSGLDSIALAVARLEEAAQREASQSSPPILASIGRSRLDNNKLIEQDGSSYERRPPLKHESLHYQYYHSVPPHYQHVYRQSLLPQSVSESPENSPTSPSKRDTSPPQKEDILVQPRWVSAEFGPHDSSASSSSSPSSLGEREEEEDNTPRKFVNYPPSLKRHPSSHHHYLTQKQQQYRSSPSAFAVQEWYRVSRESSPAVQVQPSQIHRASFSGLPSEYSSSPRANSPETRPIANSTSFQDEFSDNNQSGKTLGVTVDGELILEELENVLNSVAQDSGPALPPIMGDAIPPPTSELNRNDVLCGRGGETNHHTGNVKYRQLVKACQPAYILAKRRHKPKIASLIVAAVRRSGGRFLKKDCSGLWHDVGNTKAREKTSQALREGAPELRNLGGSAVSTTSPSNASISPKASLSNKDSREDVPTSAFSSNASRSMPPVQQPPQGWQVFSANSPTLREQLPMKHVTVLYPAHESSYHQSRLHHNALEQKRLFPTQPQYAWQLKTPVVYSTVAPPVDHKEQLQGGQIVGKPPVPAVFQPISVESTTPNDMPPHKKCRVVAVEEDIEHGNSPNLPREQWYSSSPLEQHKQQLYADVATMTSSSPARLTSGQTVLVVSGDVVLPSPDGQEQPALSALHLRSPDMNGRGGGPRIKLLKRRLECQS